MSSNLTDAEKRLQQAIEDVLAEDETPGVLTTWVLCAHVATYLDNEEASGYPIIMMNGTQPIHVMLGLLSNATQMVHDM